jgi:hypothetical protein
VDPRLAVERVIAHIKEYAAARQADVDRGAETPRLAALLVQKYGHGLAMAVSITYESPRIADSIQKAVDQETMRIYPNWRAGDHERWSARPEDVISSRQQNKG